LHSPASYFRPDDRLEKSIATKHYRAVPMLVKIDQPELSLLKGADYLSMLFLALFFGCLEYTLEEGPRWNWFSDSTPHHRVDQRSGGPGVHRPHPARGQPDHRLARLERPQLRPWLFLLVRHRDRPVRHDLPALLFLGRVRG
jgi:hypothetical protein